MMDGQSINHWIVLNTNLLTVSKSKFETIDWLVDRQIVTTKSNSINQSIDEIDGHSWSILWLINWNKRLIDRSNHQSINMIVLTLLFAALSLVSGQRNPGYDSSPLYVQTFDRAPTAVERQNSSFVYIDNFRTRRGTAFFNRGAGKDYIDLLRFPDNYGRMFPGTWWGEASFELWVFARDFVNWLVSTSNQQSTHQSTHQLT